MRSSYTKRDMQLQVTGQLWGGIHASHSYQLSEKPPATLDEARKIAGDFQNLDSAIVVTTITNVDEVVVHNQLK